MNKVKRNVITVTVLLFVCAAVYLNWSYNNRWGTADQAMVEAEDAAMEQAEQEYQESMAGETEGSTSSSYFASARLTRQETRDEALSLLEMTAGSENASQETVDSAMDAISAMATYSLQESQIENMLIAKDYDDCVVFISDDGVTVTVPAPVEGLSQDAVARITDTILSETDFTMAQIPVIEVKE